jgi:hypothetical protein
VEELFYAAEHGFRGPKVPHVISHDEMEKGVLALPTTEVHKYMDKIGIEMSLESTWRQGA